MADSIFVAFFVFKPHAACLLRVNRSVDTNLHTSRDAVNRSFHGQT